MPNPSSDPLWAHFAPLWKDLQAGLRGVLLAGGYALFLKQTWQFSVGLKTTLVPLSRWNDITPRATADLDLLATDLALIGSQQDQLALSAILAKHGFEVVEHNARWQFAKAGVSIDFHACPPMERVSGVRVDGRRIKPPKPISAAGVHARANPEAEGGMLQPFCFSYRDLEITIPNALTLAIMKLAAMRDRREASLRQEASAAARQTEEAQARKHAQDVCRVLAMLTREEADTIPDVRAAISTTDAFTKSAHICSEFFKPGGWGLQAVEPFWNPQDLGEIRRELNRWFH